MDYAPFKIITNGKDKELCCAAMCRNKKASRDRFCPKHRHRINKHNNPLSYTYNTLKSNAKRRGKVFTITLEDFRELCEESGYLEKKGRTAGSLSIDRIDPERGYEKGNLQVITLADNVRKMHADKEGNKVYNEYHAEVLIVFNQLPF